MTNPATAEKRSGNGLEREITKLNARTTWVTTTAAKAIDSS